MNYKLNGETIFLKEIEAKPKSTIILSDQSNKPLPTNMAMVTHIGDKVTNLKVGDVVVYKFGFERMFLEESIYLVGNCYNILAVVEGFKPEDYQPIK